MRSKSEVIVADTLTRLGMSYRYEGRLEARDEPNDFRLPDFTIMYEGDTWYQEHLGMLSVPSYLEKWERKQTWYEKNSYNDSLLTSEDGADGSIDVPPSSERLGSKFLAVDIHFDSRGGWPPRFPAAHAVTRLLCDRPLSQKERAPCAR